MNDHSKLKSIIYEINGIDLKTVEKNTEEVVESLLVKTRELLYIKSSVISETLNISDQEKDELTNKLALIEDKLLDELYDDKDSFEQESIIRLLNIIESIRVSLVAVANVNAIQMKIDQFNEKERQFDEKIKATESNVDKTQTQIITILSIFAGIIIAFFGGMNLLAGAIQNFNLANKFMSYVLVIIIGLIMFNVIYMLLYTIAKIIRVPINMGDDRDYGKREKNSFVRMIKRYPLVVYFNIASVWAIFTISTLYVINKEHSELISYVGGMTVFYPCYFIIVVLLLVFFFVLIGKISGKSKNKDEKSYIANSKNRVKVKDLDKELEESKYNLDDIEF